MEKKNVCKHIVDKGLNNFYSTIRTPSKKKKKKTPIKLSRKWSQDLITSLKEIING